MCQGGNDAARCRRGLWAAQTPSAPHARLEATRRLCSAGSAEPLRPPRGSDNELPLPQPADPPAPDAAHERVSARDALAEATTVDAVLDVVAKHGVHKLSLWNLTGALARLTQLSNDLDEAAAQALRADPRVVQLVDGFAPHMVQTPRASKATSRAFISAARLGVVPPQAWLDSLWATTGREMPQLPPGALCYLALGCVLAKVTPPDDWLLRFWHASAGTLHTFGPRYLASVFCSVASLKLTPPDYWLARFWRPSEAALHVLAIEQLLPCFHALVKLKVMPPHDWLRSFWRAATKAVADLPTADLLLVLSDCARLGVYPSDEWMDAYFHYCAARLPQMEEPAEVHKLFLASAKLGFTPPPEFMETFWKACERKLARGGNAAHVALLTACCRTIDIVPPAAILDEYWSVLLGRLPSLSVQELSEALLSAAVMQLWDAPLLKAVYRRLEKAYSADVATWSTRDTFDVFDFYSAYLAAAAERPGLLPAPRRSVLGAARELRRAKMMAPDPATEGVRGDMAACLEQLGVDYAAAVWCERSETRVDFALPSGAGAKGAPGVALLLHRPVRAVRTPQPPGRMRLRLRLLQAHGWRVAVVAADDWAEQRTWEHQVALLRRVLADAGVM